ncbi:MAG: hypothetical protein OXD43_02880, partial [Bacteroidetes bacterium]|nr:hypothetical protein [Bacteroidota bacterium]
KYAKIISLVAPIGKANSQIPAHTGNPDSAQPKTHIVALGKLIMNNMGPAALCHGIGGGITVALEML